MKLSLVVLTSGKQEGKLLPIGPLSHFLIGRDPQCHLRPASAAISKRHCAIIQREDKVFIRDFDSTNGTFVNEQPVKGEVELNHDDRVRVGPLEFAVQIETSASPLMPTPAPASKKTTTDQPTKPAVPQKKTELQTAGEKDDDVAAMLLSLQDDGDGTSSSLGSGEVPEGSTVMDMPVPPEVQGQETPKDQTKNPVPTGNTSNAARAILEKYMKRPR